MKMKSLKLNLLLQYARKVDHFGMQPRGVITTPFNEKKALESIEYYATLGYYFRAYVLDELGRIKEMLFVVTTEANAYITLYRYFANNYMVDVNNPSKLFPDGSKAEISQKEIKVWDKDGLMNVHGNNNVLLTPTIVFVSSFSSTTLLTNL